MWENGGNNTGNESNSWFEVKPSSDPLILSDLIERSFSVIYHMKPDWNTTGKTKFASYFV
jgi:hypothetical protein